MTARLILTPNRLTAAGLLLAATAAFAIGAVVERSACDAHADRSSATTTTPTRAPDSDGGQDAEGGASADQDGQATAEGHSATELGGQEGSEELLGINPESTAWLRPV